MSYLCAMVEIKPCLYTQLSRDQINRLYDLMLHAYSVTEVEIWGENYARMSKEEYVSLLQGNSVHIAWIKGEIVGSIYFYPISDEVFGFGLLNADFAESGKGIGRALIAAAEHSAFERGAKSMQLEILKPRDLEVPFKDRLSKWYINQGYTFTGTYGFVELKPDKAEKAKKMVNPSVFDVYSKALIS